MTRKKRGVVIIKRESPGNYLVLVDGEHVADLSKNPEFTGTGFAWCLLTDRQRTYVRTKAQGELEARSRWDASYVDSESNT